MLFSVAQSFLTICDSIDCSIPGLPSFTISWSLLKLMSIESVLMPTNYLILCHPPLLLHSIFPSIRVFSNGSALHIRWPQYWSFSFSTSPFNKFSGLISISISLQSKGLSRVFSNTTVLKHHSFRAQPFYGPTLTSYMTAGKTIALTLQIIVGKIMFLLFNICLGLFKFFFQTAGVF